MPLAFSASQQLSLATIEPANLLPEYLDDEARVVAAILDARQLVPLGPGHYRYTVTRVQVFQLQVQPIVELQARHQRGRLELEAVDCHLEGLGVVDDFQLQLHSWLQATGSGLEGEASLAVQVSQPPLLRLIPPRVLEATGRSVLSGILLGIRRRVGQQLAADFQAWCQGRIEGSPDP
jgi:hypothetical protein